ncbi:MAG: hypothetical protein L0Y57_00765 [Beijerinckiaceae bacterium]|nr:hypothetical protein [Beijerinckiaceae bacterium]
MFCTGRLAAVLILGSALFGPPAEAQDTSLMDMNMNMGCMLMAGMHELQVSIYPTGALDDMCQDLPGPGPALVSISSGANEIRNMTAEVRIVRGGETELPASNASLAPVTLAYLPPKTYPSGVITLTADFDKAGKYAVLVTLTDGKDMVDSGQLVVTVGEASRQWIIALIFSVILVAAALGFFIWDHRRKAKAPVKGS